jgi:hypothetical protein
MTKTAQPIGLDARAELRAWYRGRLRPRLESALAAGTIEAVALDALDDQLGELLDDPDGPRNEVA